MGAGVARLAAACESALQRLEAAESVGIAPDVYAPLGETLFWLCALAESTGHSNDAPIKGLRWARHRVTHGALVAAPVDWQYGSELGRLVLGRSRLGTRSHYRWLPRSSVPTGPGYRQQPQLEQAYDQYIDGGEVVAILRSALAGLPHA